MKKKLFENISGNQFKVVNENYLDRIGIDKLMHRAPDSPSGIDWQDLEELVEDIKLEIQTFEKNSTKINNKNDINMAQKVLSTMFKLISVANNKLDPSRKVMPKISNGK